MTSEQQVLEQQALEKQVLDQSCCLVRLLKAERAEESARKRLAAAATDGVLPHELFAIVESVNIAAQERKKEYAMAIGSKRS